MGIYMQHFDKKQFSKSKSNSLIELHDQKISLAQRKFVSTRQFYSLSLLGQNVVWTNTTSGKINLKKTNTPHRVVKKDSAQIQFKFFEL